MLGAAGSTWLEIRILSTYGEYPCHCDRLLLMLALSNVVRFGWLLEATEKATVQLPHCKHQSSECPQREPTS